MAKHPEKDPNKDPYLWIFVTREHPCREHPLEKGMNIPNVCTTYIVSFLDERDCLVPSILMSSLSSIINKAHNFLFANEVPHLCSTTVLNILTYHSA
jgi:hypothetical protein